jgi:hypothetical protein
MRRGNVACDAPRVPITLGDRGPFNRKRELYIGLDITKARKQVFRVFVADRLRYK